MATLRQMIDCAVPLAGNENAKPVLRKPVKEEEHAVDPATQMKSKPAPGDEENEPGSPMAQHISKNLVDPLGTTKEGFNNLNQKKMEYDMAKQEMMRNLLPVKSVIQHVEQMHDMNQNGIPDELENPDAQTGYDPRTQGAQPPVNPKLANLPQMNKPAAPGTQAPAGMVPGRTAPSSAKQVMPQKMQQNAPGARPGATANQPPKKGAMPGGKKPVPGAGRAVNVHINGSAAPACDNRSQTIIAAATGYASLLSTPAKKEDKKSFKATTVRAGGPGSGCHGPNCGRHKGTGMTNDEFIRFAQRVGMQRNENRTIEDAHRNAGRHEEANKIYNANKEKVRQMLIEHKVHPKDFDSHMKQISKGSGKRVNVKMQNMFPDFSFKSASVRAGGPGSGCHGPNCGRNGGGSGTDKTHLPKKATVPKDTTNWKKLGYSSKKGME